MITTYFKLKPILKEETSNRAQVVLTGTDTTDLHVLKALLAQAVQVLRQDEELINIQLQVQHHAQ